MIAGTFYLIYSGWFRLNSLASLAVGSAQMVSVRLDIGPLEINGRVFERGGFFSRREGAMSDGSRVLVNGDEKCLYLHSLFIFSMGL
jgi:hypothetical protein